MTSFPNILSSARSTAVTLTLIVCTLAPLPALAQLSADERSDLLFMREEEKLARDLYNRFYQLWGTDIFANIAISEQRHMDAILGLLQLYGVSDPVGSNGPGVFTNAEVQALYNQLSAQGTASQLAALQVGVEVEETDIADIEQAIARADDVPIDRVYGNLLLGSTNHLAAFENRLLALGGPGQGPGGGSDLSPGTSVYDPISRTLYIPAIDVVSTNGQVVVYDAMLRLVESLPQTLELISASPTTRTPNPIHASVDLVTGIVIIPVVAVGALSISAVEGDTYRLELEQVSGTTGLRVFAVTELQVNE